MCLYMKCRSPKLSGSAAVEFRFLGMFGYRKIVALIRAIEIEPRI